MDLPTFCVEMTKALAWPFVVLGAITTFQRPVTKVIVSSVRMIRRANKVHVGDFEVAMEAIGAAADEREAKAEEVEEKLVQEDLGVREKELLLAQLSEARAEAERLRVAEQQLRRKLSLHEDAFASETSPFKLDSSTSNRLRTATTVLCSWLADKLIHTDAGDLDASLDLTLDVAADLIRSAKAGTVPTTKNVIFAIETLEASGYLDFQGRAKGTLASRLKMTISRRRREAVQPAA